MILEMDSMEEIENLIPHRQRLKLIDTIISVDQEHAVTLATVTEGWPLLSGDDVSPLVLIELAAQTAGVCIGWNEKIKTNGPQGEARGWLVGIKKAHFYIDKIPLGTGITIRSDIHLIIDNYKEIEASITIGNKLAAEINLQILQATPDSG